MAETAEKTRRIEFIATPAEAYQGHRFKAGEVYDLRDDIAARWVTRNLAKYLDESDRFKPVTRVPPRAAAEAVPARETSTARENVGRKPDASKQNPDAKDAEAAAATAKAAAETRPAADAAKTTDVKAAAKT